MVEHAKIGWVRGDDGVVGASRALLRFDLVLGHRLHAILRCGLVAFSQDESGWPFHRLVEVVGIGEGPDRVATTKTLNPL